MPDDNITFTIDDVKIYGFGNTSYYDFVIDAGRYLFGYTRESQKCRTEVLLKSGNSYVFNLAPDCAIEMQ